MDDIERIVREAVAEVLGGKKMALKYDARDDMGGMIGRVADVTDELEALVTQLESVAELADTIEENLHNNSNTVQWEYMSYRYSVIGNLQDVSRTVKDFKPKVEDAVNNLRFRARASKDNYEWFLEEQSKRMQERRRPVKPEE